MTYCSQLGFAKDGHQWDAIGIGVAELLHRAGVGFGLPKFCCNAGLPQLICQRPALGEEAFACTGHQHLQRTAHMSI